MASLAPSRLRSAFLLARPGRGLPGLALSSSLRRLSPCVPQRAFIASSAPHYHATRALRSDFKDLDAEGTQPTQQKRPKPTPKSPAKQVIVELNESNFELVVMNQALPVLLECYSPNLSSTNPALAEYSEVLRQAVLAEEGYLILARLDVTANMNLAQDLRVSQVPTVLALVGGRALNVIPGIPSKETVEKLVAGLMAFGFADESQYLVEEADEALKANDIETAAKKFSEMLTIKRYHMGAMALTGLAQCALKENNVEVANQLINQVKEKYPETTRHPRIKQVISEVELASSNVKTGNEEELLKKIEANPRDWEARYEYAMACQARGRHEEAMSHLFEIIRGDREWNNQAARTLLLKMFDSMGEDSELATKGRKRLNNLWFL